MVVRAGRLQTLLILISVLSAPLSLADASGTVDTAFAVSVDSHTVEYGKSIVLTAQGDKADIDLQALWLSELEQDFAIEPINGHSSDGNQTDRRGRQWRLYPRRPGQLTLPALEYAGHKSKSIDLTVTPAIDPRDGRPIRLITEIPDTKVWLRQAVTLRMTLETATSIIVLRRDEAVHDALEIRELTNTEQPFDGERQRYRHTTGWVVHPLRKGQHQIQLPALRYVRDGVTTHRFYPPVLQLAVRPLPAYLPPQMPVGKLSFQIDMPNRFVFTNQLRNLKIKLQGQGIRRQDLPQLERQLTSSADITLYPAQQTRREQTETGRLISQSDYEIPLSVKQSGRISLPELRLDYFDPAVGRITSLIAANKVVYAINRWLFYLLVAILLVTLWIGIHKLLPVVKRHVRRLHGYIRVLALLPLADSDERVIKLLRELARKEGWPANLTLAHWLQCWQNHYAPDTRLEQAVEALMLKRYAGQPVDIRQVREQIHIALSRQHVIAGWIGRFKPVNT